MEGRTDTDGRSVNYRCSPPGSSTTREKLTFAAAAVAVPVERLKELAQEQLRIATAEKAYADEARQEAKRQVELAEQQFADAKRIRQQAIGELQKAHALKEHATEQVNSIMLQITCNSCKQKFQHSHAVSSSWLPLLPFAEASFSSCENSLGLSNDMIMNQSTKKIWESLEMPIGSITRERRKRFKDTLQGFVKWICMDTTFVKDLKKLCIQSYTSFKVIEDLILRIEGFGIHGNQVQEHWSMIKVQKDVQNSAPAPKDAPRRLGTKLGSASALP